MYYWTTEPETPARYHDNADCPRGKQILPEHRATGASRPPGRTKCLDC